MISHPTRSCWLFSVALLGMGLGAGAPSRLTIEPSTVILNGPRDAAQLLATGFDESGAPRDLTHQADWTVADPKVATIAPGGYLLPFGDGQTEVIATVGTNEARARVEVRNSSRPRPM